jgi:hypothetical protein
VTLCTRQPPPPMTASAASAGNERESIEVVMPLRQRRRTSIDDGAYRDRTGDVRLANHPIARRHLTATDGIGMAEPSSEFPIQPRRLPCRLGRLSESGPSARRAEGYRR